LNLRLDTLTKIYHRSFSHTSNWKFFIHRFPFYSAGLINSGSVHLSPCTWWTTPTLLKIWKHILHHIIVGCF